MKNEQAPDVQGNSKDGLAGDLAQGSSTTGMSGGVNPDGASTETGYAVINPGNSMSAERDGFDDLTPELPRGGVVGRPSGWER